MILLLQHLSNSSGNKAVRKWTIMNLRFKNLQLKMSTKQLLILLKRKRNSIEYKSKKMTKRKKQSIMSLYNRNNQNPNNSKAKLTK